MTSPRIMWATKTNKVAYLRAINALIKLLPVDTKVRLLREVAETAKRNPDWESGVEWAIDAVRQQEATA